MFIVNYNMKLHVLFLLVCGSCAGKGAIDLEVDGEVSFDLKLPSSVLKHMNKAVSRNGVLRENMLLKVEKSHVTAGPVVECLYQYPEKKQIDAILSNMMNVLTKVFVRTHDFFKNEEARRAQQDGDNSKHQETRFRVVASKKTQFFEHIYHNMSNEYSEFYNRSVARMARPTRDPCQYQAEIKLIWRKLLDNSLATFRRAALQCVGEHLNIQPYNENVRSRLGQFLVRELSKVRSEQLHLLCDKFQLCYYELL